MPRARRLKAAEAAVAFICKICRREAIASEDDLGVCPACRRLPPGEWERDLDLWGDRKGGSKPDA